MTKDVVGVGVIAEAYTVNAVNEYVSVAGVTRTHDDNGNLTDDGQRSLFYDYKNRLVAVSDRQTGAPVAAYEYLADGRRAKKKLFGPTGQVVKATAFFYDGAQEVEEQDATSGATEATYVWSPVYVDELVTYTNASGTFFTHQDARCNVVAITDAAGQVVERVRYDDFGRAEVWGPGGEVRAASAVGCAYGFQGRRLDAETGLLYFRARMYDPETGRFLQRDPVWDAGNVGGQYTFCGNGPLSRRDPGGRQGISNSDALMIHARALQQEERAWQAAGRAYVYAQNYDPKVADNIEAARLRAREARLGLWVNDVSMKIAYESDPQFSQGMLEQIQDTFWDISPKIDVSFQCVVGGPPGALGKQDKTMPFPYGGGEDRLVEYNYYLYMATGSVRGDQENFRVRLNMDAIQNNTPTDPNKIIDKRNVTISAAHTASHEIWHTTVSGPGGWDWDVGPDYTQDYQNVVAREGGRHFIDNPGGSDGGPGSMGAFINPDMRFTPEVTKVLRNEFFPQGDWR